MVVIARRRNIYVYGVVANVLANPWLVLSRNRLPSFMACIFYVQSWILATCNIIIFG